MRILFDELTYKLSKSRRNELGIFFESDVFAMKDSCVGRSLYILSMVLLDDADDIEEVEYYFYRLDCKSFSADPDSLFFTEYVLDDDGSSCFMSGGRVELIFDSQEDPFTYVYFESFKHLIKYKKILAKIIEGNNQLSSEEIISKLFKTIDKE